MVNSIRSNLESDTTSELGFDPAKYDANIQAAKAILATDRYSNANGFFKLGRYWCDTTDKDLQNDFKTWSSSMAH